MKILVIHGPNLDLLGEREPDIYGTLSLDDINNEINKLAKKEKCDVSIIQTNHEGEIVEAISRARDTVDALVINPAAYTHTSVAIRDAIVGTGIPTVEVHLSNIHKREEFRQKSFVAPVAVGQISGFGMNSYLLGIKAAIDIVKRGGAGKK